MPVIRRLLLAVLAGLMAPGLTACAAGEPAIALTTTARPGLPELAFEDLEGNARTLAELRGRVVVLNVWATWCAPCREEMPSLERLQADWPKEQVTVVALSVDRAKRDRVAAFAKEVGMTQALVVHDKQAAAARALKLPGLPATLILDKQGREAARVFGVADWDGPATAEKLRQLLAEPPG